MLRVIQLKHVGKPCLDHEANVEQIFSLAGRISDPNMMPERLAVLTRIHFNKKTSMPTMAAIRERYFKKFRKAGEAFVDCR